MPQQGSKWLKLKSKKCLHGLGTKFEDEKSTGPMTKKIYL
jgi:hypothetical protein